MPYGKSWFRFLSFATLSIVSMAAGSQIVHNIYKPLDDLDHLIEEALKAKLSEDQNVLTDKHDVM